MSLRSENTSKNNDDTRRQITQLRKDIELILEKIRKIIKMVDLRYLENYSKRVFLLAVSFVSGCFVSPSELKLSNFNFRTLTNECENKFIFSLSTDSQTIDRLSKAYGQKYLNLDFLENQGKKIHLPKIRS